MIVVRYADDLVVGFEHRAEAVRFLEECRERLSKFGLELNSEKTRPIEFGRFAAQNRRQRGEGKPETFTFLGFTHYCGKRRDGAFTAKKRMAAKLKAIKLERRRRKHVPIAQVGDWLRKVTPGYYLCHAVPGNLNRLTIFRHRLARLWRLVLQQRSQRGRLSWERMHQLLARWIPVRRAMHPYPRDRFDANHPRWKPYSWTPRRMGVPPCS